MRYNQSCPGCCEEDHIYMVRCIKSFSFSSVRWPFADYSVDRSKPEQSNIVFIYEHWSLLFHSRVALRWIMNAEKAHIVKLRSHHTRRHIDSLE